MSHFITGYERKCSKRDFLGRMIGLNSLIATNADALFCFIMIIKSVNLFYHDNRKYENGLFTHIQTYKQNAR